MDSIGHYSYLVLLNLCASICQAVDFDQSSQGLTEVPVSSLGADVTVVILDANAITSIKNGTFGTTLFLDTLSIKNNGLTYIGPDAFTGTVLRVLQMLGNSMNAIPDLSSISATLSEIHAQQNSIRDIRHLAGLSVLTKVHLNQNMVTAIPSGLLHTLPSIELVSIIKNAITTLEDLTVVGTKFTFKISSNPIECICSMAWVLKVAESNLTLEGTCSTPAELNGIQLIALNRSNLCEEDTTVEDATTLTSTTEQTTIIETTAQAATTIIAKTTEQATTIVTTPEATTAMPTTAEETTEYATATTQNNPNLETTFGEATTPEKTTTFEATTDTVGNNEATTSHNQPSSTPGGNVGSPTTIDSDQLSSVPSITSINTMKSGDWTTNGLFQMTSTHSAYQATPPDGFGILQWESWGAWLHCPLTCGGATQLRFRLCAVLPLETAEKLTEFKNCSSFLPMPGSNISLAYSITTKPCGTDPCPVDGRWLSWMSWGKCTATCGLGTFSRNRACTEPQNGGRDCQGDAIETQLCDLDDCPIESSASARIQKRRDELLPTEVYTEADKRPSAVQIGSLGIGLIATVFVIIAILDLPRLMEVFRCSRVVKKKSKKDKRPPSGHSLRQVSPAPPDPTPSSNG